MAQIPYRANLSAAIYPMTLAEAGRTVINPGADQNFDRRVDPTGAQKDAGIPQAMYMDNVLPTASGYQSVSFLQVTAPMTGFGGTYIAHCVDLKILFGSDVIITMPLFLAPTGAARAGAQGTYSLNVTGTAPAGAAIAFYTSAACQATAYLYESPTGEIWESTIGFAPFTIDLVNITASITPAGFFASEAINSITSSYNYLIAANSTTVFWSSTTTPTDFVSSLVSGAGSIQLDSAIGTIQYVKECPGGFYVYGSKNIVFAQYTGNSRYPWKFTPVANSNGIIRRYPELSYGHSDSSTHYVIEQGNQLKALNQDSSVGIAPEVTDFIAKTSVQAVYDYATNIFTPTQLSTGTPSIISWNNRYILLSVNGSSRNASQVVTSTSKYTHIIVFDTLLQRYGRLKLDHTFAFVVDPLSNAGDPVSRLAFVNIQTNTIYYLNLDVYNLPSGVSGLTNLAATAALVLGKYQFVRNRKLKLEDVEIESALNSGITTPNLTVVHLPSLDGKNFSTPTTLTPSYSAPELYKYPVHKTAENHTLILKGSFNVNTVALKFTLAGER